MRSALLAIGHWPLAPYRTDLTPAANSQQRGDYLGSTHTIVRDFTKLEMWQLGMDIAVEVTEILETIPTTKAGYKIRDQADDAACSIASNIAEGSSRRSEKEKYRYFEYALGSAFELQTRMLILQRRKYADEALVNGFLEKVVTVQKKIGAFMGVLNA